jgi:malic enzyme
MSEERRPRAVTAANALSIGRDVYFGHCKIEILPKVAVTSLWDMAVSYTPGVGHVVKHLLEHPEALGEQVAKDNMIALVTDGSAVLGYGNVGPYAGMPVMVRQGNHVQDARGHRLYASLSEHQQPTPTDRRYASARADLRRVQH